MPPPFPPHQGRDPEAATGFLDEITLLKRLKGAPHIIQLVDAEVHRAEGMICMVLECGDIDLARLLQVGWAAGRGSACVFVCVCVLQRGRERERTRERNSPEGERRERGGGISLECVNV
jgi:hypothetical protein